MPFHSFILHSLRNLNLFPRERFPVMLSLFHYAKPFGGFVALE